MSTYLDNLDYLLANGVRLSSNSWGAHLTNLSDEELVYYNEYFANAFRQAGAYGHFMVF